MLTKAQRKRLIKYLATHELTMGLGTESACCSMGAINLARKGEVDDSPPPDMSEVTARFIIRVQDMMPRAIRNSQQWKDLLPDAADTMSGGLEDRRVDLIVKWMWRSLAYMQAAADERGFGSQWAAMIKDKTDIAAHAAELEACESLPYPPDINNLDWIVPSRMAVAASDAREVIIYADDYTDDDDPCPICASVDAIASAADAIACQHENREQGLLEFWWKVNPPGMLKKLMGLTYLDL